ncbi:hypothetical protein [Mycobacterium tuberculosis]|uniref:hypothetical protein n=1 Tax=Mycobacterium tuberculosis TaxID=1773 RepID=UPI00207B18F6|nr:hypothetical protein [Mycobacterium tuberculosis]
MYTSHNFWCAAAVSAAVYVGSAVVPAAVAGPLFVGRVSATIKAAAPSTTAAIAVSVHSTCMPAAFGGHLGLGDRSRSVSLSGTP